MWQIEQTPEQHLDRALALVVSGGRAELASPHALRELRTYLDSQPPGRVTVWWACEAAPQGPREVAAAVIVHSPGKTALVLHSSTDSGAVPAEALVQVISAAARAALSMDCVMAQALLDPSASSDVRAFTQAGFSRLAELIYMRLNLRGPAAASPAMAGLEFASYGRDTHDDFARAITASYAGSLDCPGMEGLRGVQDAIAAHQAAGIFRPDLWTLASLDGRPAGIILLNENAPARALEVVYMGVAAPFRGRGLGRALLARALQLARREHFSALCLAVDSANHFAHRLYAEFGFAETFRRLAYVRT